MKTFVANPKKTLAAAATIVALGASLAAVSGAGNEANARVVAAKPNLQHYCNTYHRGSRVYFNYRFNTYACVRRGNYSLRHYRVNMARACKLSHGTHRYRYAGSRRNPVCLRHVAGHGNGHGHQVRYVQPRLNAYCRARYGYARANFHYGRSRWVCSVRGNYQVRHYFINMARACRYTAHTSRYRYFGDRRVVRCVVRV